MLYGRIRIRCYVAFLLKKGKEYESVLTVTLTSVTFIWPDDLYLS